MNRPRQEDVARMLGSAKLFKSIPENDLKELASVGRHERFAAGDAIYRKGSPGTYMFLLVDGRVKITVNGPTGNELLLSLVEPTEIFGEIAAIDDRPRTVNAIATRASEVIAFDRRFLVPILSGNPESAQALFELLCLHLRTAVANLEKVALLNAQTRLWARLVDLGRRYSSATLEDGAIRIDHGLSQQSLADSIGVTRVMVNRQLGSWRERGLIEDGRGYIVIPDPDALERFVHDGGPQDEDAASEDPIDG